MTNKIIVLNSFVMPNEDETFDITVSDTKNLSPKCWIWNASVGYFEVVKYSLYNSTITVRNLGRRENAKLGTEFPTCMEFLITAPTALDPYNPLSTCLAADFNSPTVGQEAYMSVGSTYVLKADDQIIVDGDYRYSVTQVVNSTTLKVLNEGLGKDGIIEVGCSSCVPVQVVSNLNCCPIPTGDLTSNTSVLTVNNGDEVLLDSASLTLDTDLSKYDNSTSEFITLTDVPRGTLDSTSPLLGITGGVDNVLGDITLSLNTDLSQYDNTNSEFITVGDIPRGELSSSTNILTVSNGANNVLSNIELSIDTDLSKYDNTTSSFVSTSDKKNLTSNTSVLSVTNGTGSTLENTSLTLDTDLSKYDNTTSSFISSSDKKTLTSTSSIITVTNGTGATLEDVSLTINTDLSQYDNTNSEFITVGNIPRGDLSSSTNILTVSNGEDNVLNNIELSVDTDLSKYDNTTSEFITVGDIPRGGLSSSTNILTVSNGTGATLENTSLTLDTDLSKYDNSNSWFITFDDIPRGTLNSNSSILWVAGGVGSTLENVTVGLNTDLSQYDNTTSGFITGISSLNDIGDVTITTPSANEILKYDGSKWVNGSPSTGTINWGDIGGTLSNQTDLNNALSGKQAQLNGTGFVKANGTTISYDNTTYQARLNGTGFVKASGTTISYDNTNYIPLAGSSSISGSLIPAAVNNSYAIGAPSYFWNAGYIVNFVTTNVSSASGLVVGATGILQLYANGNTTNSLYFASNVFYPGNRATLGNPPNRWGGAYLHQGTPLDLNGTLIYHESSGNYRSMIKRTSTTGGIFVVDSDEVGVRIAHGATSWATASDRRQKKNIVELEDSLETINALIPIRFNYNEEKEDAPSRVGFVAQEIREVIPEAVTGEETETEFLAVSMTEVIPFMVKAIQELSSKVDELNAKIELLEGRL